MIVSLVSSRARRAWLALEPYILVERRLRSPTYLSFFEHLVCLIADADPAKHPREPRPTKDRFRFVARANGIRWRRPAVPPESQTLGLGRPNAIESLNARFQQASGRRGLPE